MDNLRFALEGAWKVLAIGLVVGAGVPVVFALGIRSLAFGAGGDAETDHAAPHPLGRVLATLCFVVVVAVVAIGLAIIVASGLGKEVSFDHVFPTFADKK